MGRYRMKAVILAGGENKRLPLIKGFLEIEGKKIIESCIEVLDEICEGVVISTNNPERYCYLGVPMVGDVVRHKGPMTGILSALVSLKVPEVFVVACDMPFIKPALVRDIVDKWMQNTANSSPVTRHSSLKNGWDALIPIFDNKPQPLLGIYSRSLINKIENSISEGNRGLRKFLKGINVRYINENEVRSLDPEGRSFVNINTLEEYKRVIKSGEANRTK